MYCKDVDRRGQYHGDVNAKGELVDQYYGPYVDGFNKLHGWIGRAALAAMPIT